MINRIRSSIANWLTPKNAAPISSEVSGMASGLSFNHAPPRRGVNETLKAYADMPQLQRVFGRIASSVAGVPYVTYRVRGKDGKAMRFRRLEHAPFDVRERLMKRLSDTNQLEEIENDPLVDFLEAGNTMLTGFECREVMQLHLDLAGECFARKERNAAGMPVRYWPIQPGWVRDVPSVGKDFFEIQVSGATEKVPAEDIIWIKMPDPYRPYERGVGNGVALADELATDEYAAGYLRTFFFNNGTPSSIVVVPDASAAQLRRLEAHWDQRNRGVTKAHRTHFLNSADTKVTALSSDMRHLSMTELRRFISDAVRETPGVPPEIVGQIENSNRATIDAATFIFARWVLVPRLDRWCDALQNQIVPDFDKANKGIKKQRILSYESPIPEDRNYNLEVARAAPWAFSRADWREMAGYEPNAADDVYMQPTGQVERPIDDETWEPEPPPAPVVAAPPVAPEVEPDDNDDNDESKALTKRGKAVGETDANALAAEIDPFILTNETEPLWDKELRDWGDDVLASLGLDPAFNMLNPKVIEHLNEFGSQRVTNINNTTREAIRKTVAEAVSEGEDYRALAKRVTGVFEEARGWRSVLIARTEPSISANFATYESQKQSGLVLKREWVATRDGRARESHLELDGVTAGINEMFIFNDGTPTIAPAQSGVPEHDIQCRCTTIPVFDDDEDRAVDGDAVWKAFDDRLSGWEEKAEAAFRRGFFKQLETVIDRLREIAELNGEQI